MAQQGTAADSSSDAGGFPAAPDRVEPRWLTDVLDRAGVADGATVVEVEVIGDIGTGQAARSSRLGLRWDEPDGRPATLVGKFPSADEGSRNLLQATGGYWKEWRFYDRLAATVDMRVPACHTARYDAATTDFVLLLEDVADASAGDQLDGLSADVMAAAVDQAARFHGPWYGRAELADALGDSPTPPLTEAGPPCQMMYQMILPEFVARYAEVIGPEATAFIERAAPEVGRWFDGTDSPRTLVHHDLRADNILVPHRAGEPPVTVDFQALAAGFGPTDIAYLVGGSLADPVERAAIERDLLDAYRSRLSSYGVDLSADQLWRDYRHGALWGVIMTVLTSFGVEHTDRGDRMFAAMASRHARHAIELESLDTLA